VSCYLLDDRIPDAVRLLKAVRFRGPTPSVGKADTILKELAAVSPEAGEESKAGIPQPPPIQEIFAEFRFGIADQDAGRRYLQSGPVEIGRWVNEIAASLPPREAAPASAAPSTPPPQDAPPYNLDAFHVEVLTTSASRDLKIRPLGEGAAVTAAPQEYGYLRLEGQPGATPVLLDGKSVAGQVPVRLQLPVGKYEIRIVEGGKLLSRQDLEVTALGTIGIAVQR
jgi:hypothetical protein